MRALLEGKTLEERRKLFRQLAVTPPQDDDWLHWWVKTYLGVHIPRERVCPHHHSPFEAFAHSYFARNSMCIWEGSRGFAGKSMQLSILNLTEMITLGANTRILGGSGDQSKRVNEYLRSENPNTRGLLWDSPLAPRHLRGATSKTTVHLTNGAFVEALMASGTSIRGAHPSRLKIDEADEMDLDLFDAAMGQTMSLGGVEAQTTISSTHHYPDGVMTELKRRARDNDWAYFTWCYKETMKPHGWLDPAEVERKRREVPQAMFENEYDLQEPAFEGRVFTKEVLDQLFDPKLKLIEGSLKGRPREECVVIPSSAPGDYYHGVDFARASDWTVIHSVRKSKAGPDQLAAWQRTQRLPWPIIIAQYNNRVEAYGGDAMHDATGIGDVVGDYLTIPSEGFDFNRKKDRAEMFSSYVAAVEAGELVYPLIEPLYDAHKFLVVDDLYFSGHPDDAIVAASLAQKARDESFFELMMSHI